MGKRVIAAGCVLLIAGAAASPSWAQEGASRTDGASGLNDIVVVARKRSENIQSVPISITAISGDTLRAQGARNVEDIALTVPNLSISSSSANLSAPLYSIRGQVQNDVTAAIDQSVGVYVDGVYWARATGSNASLLDLAQVEVLKGPQGTLFGRNTTGGAVVIRSNDPDYAGVSGSASGFFGNRDSLGGDIVLNLPIITDKVALRVAGGHDEIDGYIKDTVSGGKLGGRDHWIGRAKLRLDPTEKLNILLSAEYFDFRGGGPANKLIYLVPAFDGAGNPQGLAALQALIESGFTNDASGLVGGDPFTVSPGTRPRTRSDTQTYSGTATLETSFGEAKTIVAYRRTNDFSALDNDGTPYQIFDVPLNRSRVRQWSVETNFTGTGFDDRLQWTTGMYLFDEKGFDVLAAAVVPAILGATPLRPTGSDVNNRSMAVFAQATYKLSPSLSLTGGLRYSIDDRDKVQTQVILDPAAPNCTAGTTPNAARGRCEASFQRSDADVSYLLSLDYRVASDVLLYARTARGYRAGGFNSRGGADRPDGDSFGPETVTDYEVGIKSEWFDRRLRVNAAAYYSQYSDIQSTLLTIDPNTGQGITLVQNAAKGRIAGGEVEVTAAPVKGLVLTGAVGYTDAKFLKFEDASGDRSNEAFPLTPKWTYSIGGQFTQDMQFATLTMRADYGYRGRIVFQRNLFPPYTEAPGRGLLNGRVGLGFNDNKYEIAAYGRNILNKTYRDFSLDVASAGLGFISALYGRPREYGLQASVKW